MKRDIVIGGQIVGEEHETDFPFGDDGECPSIVISHGVYLLEPFRGLGHGSTAHVARLDRFRTDGYNYAICTVRRDNLPQLAILKKNGWVRLANTASLSGTPIYLMGKNLR